jgi:hypothetical protein
VIELDERSEATARAADTDDAAVLAAAAECPMGAIRVFHVENDRRAA